MYSSGKGTTVLKSMLYRGPAVFILQIQGLIDELREGLPCEPLDLIFTRILYEMQTLA